MIRKNDLTEGSVGRQLTRLTLPMILGAFSVVAFNVADAYFIGQLGTLQLAAFGFVFPVVIFFIGLSVGLGIGAVSVISTAIGAGGANPDESEEAAAASNREVRRLTTDTVILSVLIVSVLSVLGYLTMDPVFRMLGADEATLPYIREYMVIWYAGLLLMVLPMVCNNIIRATGDTLAPGLIMLLAALLNIVLDPILIFGWFGAPALGIQGAAIATLTARGLALVASLSILYFRKRMLALAFHGLAEFRDSARRVLHIAIPAGSTNILGPVSMGIVTAMVAQYGEPAVAAMGAGIRIEGFAMMVVMALGASLVPFIGQNSGARKPERVQKAVNYCNQFSFIWGAISFILLFTIARPLAEAFSPDPAVRVDLVLFLIMVPLAYPMQGVASVTSASFNAMKRPLSAALLNLIRMLGLFVPLAWLGGQLFDLKGIFGGIVVAGWIAGVIALLWIRRVMRDRVEAVEGGESSHQPAAFSAEEEIQASGG